MCLLFYNLLCLKLKQTDSVQTISINNHLFFTRPISVPYSTFIRPRIWPLALRCVVGNDIVLSVVGNKLDLEAERQVYREQGEMYAKSLGANYFETSAVTCQGYPRVVM